MGHPLVVVRVCAGTQAGAVSRKWLHSAMGPHQPSPAPAQHQHLDINIPALRRGDTDTAPPPTAHINLVQLHYKPQQPSTQQSNVQLKHLAAV